MSDFTRHVRQIVKYVLPILILTATSLSADKGTKHARRSRSKNVQLECPINYADGDSLETLKLKVEMIKAWQAEQNAKTMAVYIGDTRVI